MYNNCFYFHLNLPNEILGSPLTIWRVQPLQDEPRKAEVNGGVCHKPSWHEFKQIGRDGLKLFLDSDPNTNWYFNLP